MDNRLCDLQYLIESPVAFVTMNILDYFNYPKYILVLLIAMVSLISCTEGECEDPTTGEVYAC